MRFLAIYCPPSHSLSMAGKRTLSVTVKMSEEDLGLLMRAAGKAWSGAIVTRSGIVLGLAKLGAESVLQKKSKT
jgi:hypothetical protein